MRKLMENIRMSLDMLRTTRPAPVIMTDMVMSTLRLFGGLYVLLRVELGREKALKSAMEDGNANRAA